MFAKNEKQAVAIFKSIVKSPISRGRFAKRVSAHFGRDYSSGSGLRRIIGASQVHSFQAYVEFFVDKAGDLEFDLMVHVKHDGCPEGESFDEAEVLGYSSFSISQSEILRLGKVEREKHLSLKLKEKHEENHVLPR